MKEVKNMRERVNKPNKRIPIEIKAIIVIVILLFVGLLTTYILKSYAKFEKKESFNIINAKVGDFNYCQATKIFNLKECILSTNEIKIPSIGMYQTVSTNLDTGLYENEDDYGTSYIFRGDNNLLNNNVIFANMQWKIVRINGDGSIRIIYNGICENNICEINEEGNLTQVKTTAFNLNYDDRKYVGYTYDTNIDSLIKEEVEEWYVSNLKNTSYDSYITDNIFCGDRSGIRSAANGFYYYAPHDRLVPSGSYNKVTPTLKCVRKVDSFTTIENSKGNGYLNEKVGLLTADEAIMAGGKFNVSNENNYLNANYIYWTISPSHFYNAAVWNVNLNGLLYINGVNNVYGLRPVINITSDISAKGDGSFISPYTIQY